LSLSDFLFQPHRTELLNNPDARSMMTRGTGIIGYNVQSHQQSLGLQPETLDCAVALSRRRGLAQ
jgi:nicotinamide mononucleotide (NMN) deamidase PncC